MIVNLFLSFLAVSISVSFIIVLMLLLTPFLNKRYAAKWKYWIWIVLALRLVFPSDWNPGEAARSAEPQVTVQNASASENAPSETAVTGTPRRRVMMEIPAQLAAPIAAQPEKSGSSLSPLDLIAGVWILGVLLFLAVHLISYFRYKRRILKSGKAVRNREILCTLLGLMRELQIKCTVPVIESAEAASPMMIGFLNPVLVLPEGQYSVEDFAERKYPFEEGCSLEEKHSELYFILKHELVHLKRGDIWFKLLFVTANAVHWFNPFIWIMQKEAAVDVELSCDERVTQGAGYAARKAYTETLLSNLQRECTRRSALSTQFYDGKQIMKKRFQNILLKTRKKNGIAVFLIAAILTLSLGTLVGCSVGKENGENRNGISEPAESGNQQVGAAAGNGMEDELPDGEIPAAVGAGISGGANGTEGAAGATTSFSGRESTGENRKILTFMKEGIAEEKQASLVTGEHIPYGYSFYLPDGEWQKAEADTWRAVENENVRLSTAFFDQSYQLDIRKILADDGYQQDGNELVIQAEGITYKARLYEDTDGIWCVFYSYPQEAEEGWGRELPVIADTFAVTAPADIFHGYISSLENRMITVDRQLWVTSESEEWKPEYEDGAGFVVLDEPGEDVTYPLHEDCTFTILENHYDPAVELSAEEFAAYLKKTEYPVLWIFDVEEGQVRSITEQYLP